MDPGAPAQKCGEELKQLQTLRRLSGSYSPRQCFEAGDSSDRLVAVEPYISARTGEIKSLECWKEFLPSQYNFDDFKNTYLRPLKLQDKYTWVPAEPLKEAEAKDINMYLGQYNEAAHDLV